MRIACLHASMSNSGLFDRAAAEAGLAAGSLTHQARPDLLDAAVQAGELTDSVLAETSQVLLGLADDADAVILTCSTLGPAARLAAESAKVPVIQADAALAAEAGKLDGNIVVLCTIEATLAPTAALFSAAAGRAVKAELVSGAWQLFQSGQLDDYYRLIAKAADASYAAGADLVVLGQASMTGAADFVAAGRAPLTVPRAALAAAISL